MFRKLWTLALIAALASPAAVNADTFYSQLGEINSPVGADSSFAYLTAGTGRTFVNISANGTFTGIGYAVIQGTQGGALPNAAPAPGGGASYVAVFALQGSVTDPSPPSLTGTVTSGAAHIYAINDAIASINPADPSTWTSGDLVATYAIAAAANLAKGHVNADPLSFGPGVPPANTFSVNLLDSDAQQGLLLLNETTGPSGDLGDLINAITFEPGGAADALTPEQLLVAFAERIENLVGDGLDLNAANAFLIALLGAAGDGLFSDYSSGVGGDFDASLALEKLIPGVQFQTATTEIPEPASVLVWGMISLAGVGIARRYRNKQ